MDINFNALAWLLIVGQTDRPQFCPVLPVIRSYLHSSACRTLLACITMQIVVAGFEMQDALGAVVNDALFSITHAYATRPSQALLKGDLSTPLLTAGKCNGEEIICPRISSECLTEGKP